MAVVTMRYWAAAKEAAGVAEETVTADTLAAALTAIRARSRLSTVLARSSFLVDGQPVGTRAAETVTLADGAVVEVLPPFAGG
jgi:molybdopterin synthase sulfur carrier subunit